MAQIIGVFDRAYELRWEKHRQPMGKAAQSGATKFDLVMQPNLKNGKFRSFFIIPFDFFSDLDPYLKEAVLNQLKSPTKTPTKTPQASPQKSVFSPKKRLNFGSTDEIKSPTKVPKAPLRKWGLFYIFQLPLYDLES